MKVASLSVLLTAASAAYEVLHTFSTKDACQKSGTPNSVPQLVASSDSEWSKLARQMYYSYSKYDTDDIYIKSPNGLFTAESSCNLGATNVRTADYVKAYVLKSGTPSERVNSIRFIHLDPQTGRFAVAANAADSSLPSESFTRAYDTNNPSEILIDEVEYEIFTDKDARLICDLVPVITRESNDVTYTLSSGRFATTISRAAVNVLGSMEDCAGFTNVLDPLKTLYSKFEPAESFCYNADLTLATQSITEATPDNQALAIIKAQYCTNLIAIKGLVDDAQTVKQGGAVAAAVLALVMAMRA